MSSSTTGVLGVTLADAKAARERIAKDIIRTPLVLSEAASERAGTPVHLKLENLQRTGAFKVRGALSKVTSLTPEERKRGLVCASTGNHGLGGCLRVFTLWSTLHHRPPSECKPPQSVFAEEARCRDYLLREQLRRLSAKS